MVLSNYSFGIGDRFAHQGRAQLAAFVAAAKLGVQIDPVWNKSHREHTTIGSQPGSVRVEADAAVAALGWDKPYFVDADHIRMETVDGFLASSDFYTIDVADSIGVAPNSDQIEQFCRRHAELIGQISISGIDKPFEITADALTAIAAKYLGAMADAGQIYRHIESAKGRGSFVTEVSIDETDSPQTPGELLVILAAIADQGIPVQTIAPKFTGRFNKGVDYVGDVPRFEREFNEDLAVIAHAVPCYGLPKDLKLSVHSGSDKFSIYGPIKKALRATGAGIHLKTAGTTWLEEIIGLAEAGGAGLALAKEIYGVAYSHSDALCAPYAAVIDIDANKLPAPESIASWPAEQFVGSVRHDQSNPEYNPSMRQLLHVGYKVAAQLGARYLELLNECEESIGRNVTLNLLDRHIKPLFL